MRNVRYEVFKYLWFRVFVIFAESRREEEKDKRVRCTHRRVKK